MEFAAISLLLVVFGLADGFGGGGGEGEGFIGDFFQRWEILNSLALSERIDGPKKIKLSERP